MLHFTPVLVVLNINIKKLGILGAAETRIRPLHFTPGYHGKV
jgi:hypothetical protein